MESNLLLVEAYLTQSTSRGVLLVNQDGQVDFVNERFFALMGIEVSAIKGTLFDPFFARLPECSGWLGVEKGYFVNQIAPILERVYCSAELFFKPDSWLQLTGRQLEQGGYAVTLTDVTAFHKVANSVYYANKNMVKSLADVAENRDNDTGEHVLKVARLTHEIAIDLHQRGIYQDSIHADFLAQIGLASMLHDVGKVAVSDAVLLKPGRLTPEEREVMQSHAEAGFRMITKIKDLQEDSAYFALAGAIALSHHEKFAGGGYPHGLEGYAIPLEARIVSVSDVYDALTSWRPYKNPWSDEETLKFMNQNSGVMFDPQVVESLLRVLTRRRQQCMIQWDLSMSVSEGEMDKDHRILIDLINQLALVKEHRDTIMLDFILDELYNYTVRHFKREEAYMLRGGYPNLTHHQRIHQEFTDRVREIRRHFLHYPDPEIANNLLPLMGNWLSEHIKKVDRDYQLFFVTNLS